MVFDCGIFWSYSYDFYMLTQLRRKQYQNFFYCFENIQAIEDLTRALIYEGKSKITEPNLIAFESSKIDIYLDDILLQIYVIYLITYFISVGRLFVTVAWQQNNLKKVR